MNLSYDTAGRVVGGRLGVVSVALVWMMMRRAGVAAGYFLAAALSVRRPVAFQSMANTFEGKSFRVAMGDHQPHQLGPPPITVVSLRQARDPIRGRATAAELPRVRYKNCWTVGFYRAPCRQDARTNLLARRGLDTAAGPPATDDTAHVLSVKSGYSAAPPAGQMTWLVRGRTVTIPRIGLPASMPSVG